MPAARDKTALVLTGGGIMGAAYEIGCLTALDQLFTPGFNSRRFNIYVGISAGSVIATLMANRISPAGLFQAIAHNERSVFNWRRKDIYRFDVPGLVGSCWEVLRNLFRIGQHYRQKSWRFSVGDLFYILQEQFPAGLFSLDPMQNYLCQSFRKEGIRDHFDQLRTELYIPAYDLDLGHRVVFGEPGHRDMHICQAITASCAIPWFFRPYQIGDHFYMDGSTGRVTHLDLAIEKGAKLVVLINPRVPMVNDRERFCLPSLSYGQCSSIADLGITFAWEQAQRIENKEKLDLGLEIYRQRYPEVDIISIEPGPEESLLFFQSPMSNDARHHIMDYGYHLTLSQLRTQFEPTREIFARHGIGVSDACLQAPPPVRPQV